MAYSATNPPIYLCGAPNGPSIWVYFSADAEATVDDAGYIANATDLGMAVGDIVFVRDTTNNLFHITHVKTISSGAASLFEATAFTGA